MVAGKGKSSPPWIALSKIFGIGFLASWMTGCSFAVIPITPPEAAGMRSLKLSNGESISYRRMGEHIAATPVLLIHGIPDSSESWIPVMKQLSQRHPVYAVDLAGYGYSGWPDNHDFSLSAQAGYLREFMEQLGLEQAILVGHDIGGGIAQILAASQLRGIRYLVLVNPAMGNDWPALEVRMLSTPFVGIAAFTLLENSMWRYLLVKGFADKNKITPEITHKYRQWFQGASGRNRLVRNARALDNTGLIGMENSVVGFPEPTLVLWARHDRFLPDTSARRICGQMPNCRFHYIEQAGHFVLDEKPDEIVEHIIRFIHR